MCQLAELYWPRLGKINQNYMGGGSGWPKVLALQFSYLVLSNFLVRQFPAPGNTGIPLATRFLVKFQKLLDSRFQTQKQRLPIFWHTLVIICHHDYLFCDCLAQAGVFAPATYQPEDRNSSPEIDPKPPRKKPHQDLAVTVAQIQTVGAIMPFCVALRVRHYVDMLTQGILWVPVIMWRSLRQHVSSRHVRTGRNCLLLHIICRAFDPSAC